MHKPTILVAGPNLLTLERDKEVLIAAGYDPVLTTALRDVPRLVRDFCPEAVIVTIDSDPAGVGWTILHELQADSKTAYTTIIFIVGLQRPLWRFARYSDVQRVLFLRQPVLPNQLVQVLRTNLQTTGVETGYLMVEQRVDSRSFRNQPVDSGSRSHRRWPTAAIKGAPNYRSMLVPIDESSSPESVVPSLKTIRDILIPQNGSPGAVQPRPTSLPTRLRHEPLLAVHGLLVDVTGRVERNVSRY